MALRASSVIGDVRLGSLADLMAANANIRFVPIADLSRASHANGRTQSTGTLNRRALIAGTRFHRFDSWAHRPSTSRHRWMSRNQLSEIVPRT